MKITDCLAAQHAVFQRQLDCLETALSEPELYQAAALKAMVETVSSPLERHSRVEEEILFPALEPHLGKEAGPLAVMKNEHKTILKTLDLIKASNQPKEPIRHLLTLLREHMAKEENVLFPMAEDLCGRETLEDLGARCAAYHGGI